MRYERLTSLGPRASSLFPVVVRPFCPGPAFHNADRVGTHGVPHAVMNRWIPQGHPINEVFERPTTNPDLLGYAFPLLYHARRDDNHFQGSSSRCNQKCLCAILTGVFLQYREIVIHARHRGVELLVLGTPSVVHQLGSSKMRLRISL